MSGCEFASVMFDTDYHKELYIADRAKAGVPLSEWVRQGIMKRQVRTGMTIHDVQVSTGFGWRYRRVAGREMYLRGGLVLVMKYGKVDRIDKWR
jgi:hypothetical protein